MKENLSVYEIIQQTSELFLMGIQNELDKKVAKNVLSQYRLFFLENWKDINNVKILVGKDD